jgi:hypothetical protein
VKKNTVDIPNAGERCYNALHRQQSNRSPFRRIEDFGFSSEFWKRKTLNLISARNKPPKTNEKPLTAFKGIKIALVKRSTDARGPRRSLGSQRRDT